MQEAEKLRTRHETRKNKFEILTIMTFEVAHIVMNAVRNVWRLSMLRSLLIFLWFSACCLTSFHQASAQTPEKPDLTKQPTLYVVGYAHLDTEWRWEYPQVIDEYIRKTMEDNFTLIDKYPHYIF